MAQLTARDIQEILQVLEDGIRLIPKLSKPKKVAMRSKIRKQYAWLSGLNDPAVGMVIHDLEERLPDLFPHYPYGFTDQLHELLKKKLGR
jgi:hypothetical protein